MIKRHPTAWADDNTVNEIPGIRGTRGDDMGGVAGRDRDGDAVFYFAHNADPNTVGRGSAATGQAFDGSAYTAYGEAPILDPDKTGQPDSRPPGRDSLPFAGESWGCHEPQRRPHRLHGGGEGD